MLNKEQKILLDTYKLDSLNAIRTLLTSLGEDINREGLLDTPYRVIKSYEEIFEGYKLNPKEILSTKFKDDLDLQSDEIVICKDIEFTSFCEHHMLPFIGVCHIGYLPKKYVVGLSKLARLVDCFSKRLQIQERMTASIAQTLYEELAPKGVGVIVKSKHLCMSCRGVKKVNSAMITSALRGQFKNLNTRNEFLQLIKD